MDRYNKLSPTELYHYGVKGMKWGVRRYQNADGSLTLAGRRRYQKDEFKNRRNEYKASMDVGKRVVNNLLLGPFANRTYASVKVSGGSDLKAYGMSVVATMLGGPLGHMAVSEIYATKNAGKNPSEDYRMEQKSPLKAKEKRVSKKQYVQAYNNASRRINAELESFNKKFDKKNGGPDWIERLGRNSQEYKEYIDSFQKLEDEYIQEELDKLK